MFINAYAAMAAGGRLEPYHCEGDGLGPLEARIEISHCGICHSDLDLIDNVLGYSVYPLVPGHEIVGRIVEVGDQVSGLQVGQRVGVGWQAAACFSCEQCGEGDENLCQRQQGTCEGRPGGFADTIQLDARFAFPLPDSLSSAGAAPLLCAGATVFAPLFRAGLKPGMRVGVIGIGGLGHLALQFAKAMGAEVTAFTHSSGKVQTAQALGADHVLVTTDASALAAVAGQFHLILSTLYSPFQLEPYLAALRPRGTLVLLGVPATPLSLPVIPLVDGQRRIEGSAIASRQEIITMLEFAGRHHVEARVECMSIRQAQEAIDRVRRGEVRFRMVLETRDEQAARPELRAVGHLPIE